MATSAILVALMVATPPLRAQGQTSEPQVGQATQRSFNIPPQPLSSALPLFGQQSGRQITADAALVRGINTPGVQGTMTIEEALRRLLAGTGLTFSGMTGDTIALQRASQDGQLAPGAVHLDPVQVQGYPVPTQAMIDNIPPPYAGGQVATGGQLGLLGNRPVMDTPFNQTNYTAKKAQDQQAKTIRDVLVDDPSVRFFVRDNSDGADQMRIRGFIVDNGDTSYGGLYGMLPSTTIMAELADRIEVLKGPSAMLNGMAPNSAIGGTVNVVPKRAPDEPLTQLTANYISAGQVGGHIDFARRVGSDKQFGIRFNGVFRAGQTDVQWQSDQRALAVLGLDFREERARFSADFGYQYQYVGGVLPNIGVANGIPLIWAPSSRGNPGQPWNNRTNEDLFAVVRGEVDVTERITAYAAFGAHDYRDQRFYGSSVLTAINFSGAAVATPLKRNTPRTYQTAEAGVRALAETGPIGHELAFTATMFQMQFNGGTTSGAPFATNLYNPTVIAPPNLATPAANKASTSGRTSFAIADTLSAADKRIQFTAGARLQQVTAANFNTTTGAQTDSYNQSAVSPSVALVFKPWENVSVYGNWIQGLQQGIIVGPQFANAGEIFPPYMSTQYEVGVKVDWGRFTTTASLFQISQPFTISDVATNTLSLAGMQRNQGLELNVFGEPMPGMRLLGGAMFLNPVLTQTQGGLTDGWIAPMSPQFTLNLAGELDLPFSPGLAVNGRVIYTGSQYIDTTWPRRSLAEWTRFDLGARYTFENPGAKGRLLVARFNVENVLDANYWQGGNTVTTMFVGAPRTFRLSLTADF